MQSVDNAVDAEAERLLGALMHVDCDPRGRTWNLETCREIAPLTLEINRLKKEKEAVILAHSYVEPEIIYGVGRLQGRFVLPQHAGRDSRAKVIVFAGRGLHGRDGEDPFARRRPSSCPTAARAARLPIP
jgi:quinolinate synthase